jgi:hypothetical protein
MGHDLMKRIDDAIERLNLLAEDSVRGEVLMETTAELLAFFKNPPTRAYSVPLEEAMTSIVKMFLAADRDGRSAITSRLNIAARNGLLGYAGTMAVLAVRTHSPILVEQGLIGLVIEGGSQDWRDSTVALAKLYHSATKLRMNARKTFQAAASLADPGIIKKEMSGFPLRPPKDRDLKAFSQAEEITEEGFRYKQVLSWSFPNSAADELPAPSKQPNKSVPD